MKIAIDSGVLMRLFMIENQIEKFVSTHDTKSFDVAFENMFGNLPQSEKEEMSQVFFLLQMLKAKRVKGVLTPTTYTESIARQEKTRRNKLDGFAKKIGIDKQEMNERDLTLAQALAFEFVKIRPKKCVDVFGTISFKNCSPFTLDNPSRGNKFSDALIMAEACVLGINLLTCDKSFQNINELLSERKQFFKEDYEKEHALGSFPLKYSSAMPISPKEFVALCKQNRLGL